MRDETVDVGRAYFKYRAAIPTLTSIAETRHSKETPNNVIGGGGLAAEAQLLTVARLEAVHIGGI